MLPPLITNNHESGNPRALIPQIHPIFEPGVIIQTSHSSLCLAALVVDSEMACRASLNFFYAIGHNPMLANFHFLSGD